MAIKIYNPHDFPAYLPKLNALYDELFSGGKGFRSRLVQMVSGPLGLAGETQNLLCQTVEFIHNASLLHDDLVDRSMLRRGKPAAWTKYSPEYAVLAGDYLLARVMVNLSGFGNIRLVQNTSEVISDLLEGEWLQDSVVGDFFVQPMQLDRIHNLKTGSLFRWCLRAPFIADGNLEPILHQTLDEMGTLLGQLFQRSDDLLDYNIRNDEGKAILGDLRSGYLNSFGAFVAQHLSRQQIDRLVKSREMKDFYLCFSDDLTAGEQLFQKKVSEFDAENSKLIELYWHHVDRLQDLLKSDNLTKQLRPLPEILYWRRKPKE
jgi:octaprenyl-diphosphate synthase